jgi:hypothetical protein
MTDIRPIETCYKGYRFRSRLEARWAVFFDTLGIEWEYEKEGYETKFGKYLPDFWFPELNCFAEVKPMVFTTEQFQKCSSLPHNCILLDQPHPTARPYYVTPESQEYGAAYSEYYEDGYGWMDFFFSQRKGRLWYLFGEDYSEYRQYETEAEEAAKSARFEHGEKP